MTEIFAWNYRGRSHPVPFETVGAGPRPALLLPALSSVSTRVEMAPLAALLARAGYRCWLPDWPGFGNQPRLAVPLAPASLEAFLDALLSGPLAERTLLGVGAGHGATYLLAAAGRQPHRFRALALAAPTWRGPLPTAMGAARRPLCRRVRQALETPVLGPLLYRANVARPIVRMMLQKHVYAEPQFITGGRLAAKVSVTRQPRARFGTAAFVSGALDPTLGREAFLELFAAPGLPPVLVLRPRAAPPKSAAEMDAAAAAGLATVVEVPGALAAHEEHAEAVAGAIAAFLEARGMARE